MARALRRWSRSARHHSNPLPPPHVPRTPGARAPPPQAGALRSGRRSAGPHWAVFRNLRRGRGPHLFNTAHNRARICMRAPGNWSCRPRTRRRAAA